MPASPGRDLVALSRKVVEIRHPKLDRVEAQVAETQQAIAKSKLLLRRPVMRGPLIAAREAEAAVERE